MIRVGVAASLPAVRAGLRALLSAAAPLGEVSTLEIVREAAALADFEPYLSQIDVLVATAEAAPILEIRRIAGESQGQIALLLLTDEPQVARELINLPLRAWGVLSLEASAEELLAAVCALHEGLLVGAPALLRPALRRYLAAFIDESELVLETLTERESQVLQLLARGLANKQIAVRLGISEHTVKFHISSIYAKLGVTNRTEAVRVGVQRGLVLL